MFNVSPIAYANTPFVEKFGIPRQPNLATEVIGRIDLIPPYDDPLALAGLEGVSHIWLLFIFHQIAEDRCQQLRVRPPRLGGNQKIGVFASRSTHRPNRIGQSVLEIDRIEGTSLYVKGIDLVDQTPIIDIKPYLPYADAISHAHNTLAPVEPSLTSVSWSNIALAQLIELPSIDHQHFKTMVDQCLAQDPRPAYSKLDTERIYGMRLDKINIRWCYDISENITVVELQT